jgi:hypothetical protein
MVGHEITVQGVTPAGIAQAKPVLLQMNQEDFPARFNISLSTSASASASITSLATSASTSVTLYQPVQRIVHVALLQLSCNTVGSPRLDPTRVESAGVVVRRIVQKQGVNQFDSPGSAWMTSSNGSCQWTPLNTLQEDQDPDPTKRPQLQSGQPELDKLLAMQSIAQASSESFMPAFVAPPAVCDAAGRTLVYAVLPTASSEVATVAPSTPQYDPATLASSLPTLLQAGSHSAPYAGQAVDYRYLSDDYAKAHNATSFLTFSKTLQMLSTVFSAFDGSSNAQALIAALNKHNVYYLVSGSNSQTWTSIPMGTFYQQAASTLLDYRTPGGAAGPTITMPQQWDGFSDADESEILAALTTLLQARSPQVSSPTGRYQDASRLYRIRIFLRIKGHAPGCPTQLVWSAPSDPVRIAAWHESAGRVQPPVPLPDPTDRNFLKNAKPNCSFAVPAGLMNAMQGASLSGLSSGSGGSGSGPAINWLCGFNIPLITICAFFVLNIFLSLLNIVFFWLPFIKICIPLPASGSGDTDGS